MLYTRSSKLCLAGLVCALSFAGCGSGKRSGGTAGTGYASFMWNIFDIEDINYGFAFSCSETGGGSVVVTLMNQATGDVYTQDPVSCDAGASTMAAGQMTTTEVPVGRYTVGFDLYGDPAVYGATPVLLDSFDASYPVDILAGPNDFRDNYAPFFVQSFIVGWAFASGSAAGYCGVVGSQYVDFDFLAAGSSTWVTSRFNCVSGQGASFPIPYGPVSAQWQLVLVDAAGQEIALLPGTNVVLPADVDVDLGTQVFPF